MKLQRRALGSFLRQKLNQNCNVHVHGGICCTEDRLLAVHDCLYLIFLFYWWSFFVRSHMYVALCWPETAYYCHACFAFFLSQMPELRHDDDADDQGGPPPPNGPPVRKIPTNSESVHDQVCIPSRSSSTPYRFTSLTKHASSFLLVALY